MAEAERIAVIPQVGNQAGSDQRRLADARLAKQQPGAEPISRNHAHELVSLGLTTLPHIPLCLAERIEAPQGRAELVGLVGEHAIATSGIQDEPFFPRLRTAE